MKNRLYLGMFESEICKLCEIAKKTNGIIVELGTFQGGTAEILAQSLPERTIYTVDNYNTPNYKNVSDAVYNPVDLRRTIFKDLPNVIFIVGDTKEVGKRWPSEIGLLIIDADHHYQNVIDDFDSWNKHVAYEGLIAFHDYKNPDNRSDVTKAVEFILSKGGWCMVEEFERLAILKKHDRET